MWFGTKDGLNRFDGYSFKIFRNDLDNKASIGSNFIHCLYEDPNGILWIGTENGLYKYDAPTENFILIDISKNAPIRAIQKDLVGNLWFIIGFTLVKYNENIQKARYYDIPNYFETSSIYVSSTGYFWVSTTTGLLKKYNPVKDNFESHDVFIKSKNGNSKWIEKMYATANGQILIGTSNQGAKIFDTQTFNYKDILCYNPDKTEIFVRNFIQVSATEFWIATESGLYIYNTQKSQLVNLRKNYNDPYSLSDNAIYTFCKDKEGGIWAGTYFGGINYYPKQYTTFKKYFPKNGMNSLSGNVVREIKPDAKGNLWIGTEDAGLNKLSYTTGLFTNFQPTGLKGSISYTNIHGILVTGNELWIGTFEHGLDVFDIRTNRVIRHYNCGQQAYSLNSNFIYCIYQVSSGEIMLGTTKGAFLYNRRNDNFLPIPGLPLNNWYSSLLKDKEGIIWAGTYGNGINFFDTKTKKSGHFRFQANNKRSLSNDRVNSIFEDSDNNLWFATEGGLCKFNRETNDFKNYTTKNAFPSNFILSILEDNKKRLWISTSKGLVCFNPKNEEINIYTKAQGLISDQFNFSSSYKNATGRMYFGSAKGLISFNPDEFIKNTYIPPIYITGLQVYNIDLGISTKGSPLKRSILYTDKIELDYSQSTFSIDFAALSYTAPEVSEYAYKMEGLDKNWTYLKTNRKAYFTKLSPGKYTFKVKASNSSGVWNQQEATLSIEVLPPIWESSWAYLLYITLGFVVIYFGVHNYQLKAEAKNRRKLELLETIKQKEIFKAKINFFTNVAHEIKTPLTLIKGPLETVIKKAGNIPEIKECLQIMNRNTNRLINLTNQLLDFRQTEIQEFSLSFVMANICELIEDIYNGFKPLAEQKNLRFQLNLPLQPIYASVDQEAFNKILSNLFTNAIKYAETEIEICLFPRNPLGEEDKFFTVEIKNDGFIIPAGMKEKIFEPFFRLKETEKQQGTGVGLALARSLAELHQGILNLKENENDFNTFSLILPLHHKNEFNLSRKILTKKV